MMELKRLSRNEVKRHIIHWPHVYLYLHTISIEANSPVEKLALEFSNLLCSAGCVWVSVRVTYMLALIYS